MRSNIIIAGPRIQLIPLLVWILVRILIGIQTPSLLSASGPVTLAELNSKGEQDSSQKRRFVYLGTYTRDREEGIHIFEMNLSSGELRQVGSVSGVKNPSFLAIHPNQEYLYCVCEVDDMSGKPNGAVFAFSIEPGSGGLTPLNHQSSGGPGPCHLVVDRKGQSVLVANYSGGSVSAIPILEDGRLGTPSAFVQHEGSSVDPRRQQAPHAHSINIDANNRFAFVADLGIDKVLVYQLNGGQGSLRPRPDLSVSTAPGAGPRHFAFRPGDRNAYVINELHSTVTAFSYDERQGRLKELQTISTLPEDFTGRNSTAEVQVHPAGKFLYGSNRGHNSIAIFRIDKSGMLTLIGHEPTQGKTPRNFGIEPSGAYLLAANQNSDSVVVFRVNESTGLLKYTGHTISVPNPVCVKFLSRLN
jgi:6-phosphogluconolactonase